jgi:hypothetical protein
VVHPIDFQSAGGWNDNDPHGGAFLRRSNTVWMGVAPTKRSPSVLEFLFGGRTAWSMGWFEAHLSSPAGGDGPSSEGLAQPVAGDVRWPDWYAAIPSSSGEGGRRVAGTVETPRARYGHFFGGTCLGGAVFHQQSG